MKTAFITSLLGITAAILFRAFIALRDRDAPPEKTASPEAREIINRLDAIKQAIAGDGDSSMVMQMRALRDESREGFKKMDGLSDAIRNALVKNLEKLMEDLHRIIGEQLKEQLQKLADEIREVLINRLGDTFVDLKDATVALNEWQRQHRAQVEQLTAAFQMTAERIAQIASECEKIPLTMDRLREIMESVHGDLESLHRQVEAFAGMREQAEQSFPLIKEHLDKIGADMSASAQGFAGLENVIRDVFAKAEKETRRIAEQHAENVEELAGNMRQTMENAQRESAERVAKIVGEGLEKFAGGVNHELERITQEWGQNMVSIAEQCQAAIDAATREKR